MSSKESIAPEAQDCSQRAVALGAHRALKTAKEVASEGEWKRCMEGLGLDAESANERLCHSLQQELLYAQRRIEERKRGSLGRDIYSSIIHIYIYRGSNTMGLYSYIPYVYIYIYVYRLYHLGFEELGERMEVQLAQVNRGSEKRLEARLHALEQSHRKLATGAQRALRMALSVQEKQVRFNRLRSWM